MKIDAENFDGVKEEIARISEVDYQSSSDVLGNTDATVVTESAKITSRRRRMGKWLKKKMLRKS